MGVARQQHWMALALEMAQQAAAQGEVPIGAVIVKDDQLIAKAHNQPIQLQDPTAHAEIQAIRLAGRILKNYRMPKTQMYVTLEPCVMCAGAIAHARIDKLIYGATDTKAATGRFLNHTVKIQGGLMAESCAQILTDFFQSRR